MAPSGAGDFFTPTTRPSAETRQVRRSLRPTVQGVPSKFVQEPVLSSAVARWGTDGIVTIGATNADAAARRRVP